MVTTEYAVVTKPSGGYGSHDEIDRDEEGNETSEEEEEGCM
jgi:hypothetical protein